MGRRPIMARNTLAGLSKTIHGGQAWRFGDVEDYSHNLNPFGPPDDIGDIILSATEGIGHYPDDSCHELKNVISREFGVDVGKIMIGSGSSDIIRNFPNTFFDPGDTVLLNRPSFAEYGQQCRIAGVGIKWNDLTEEEDFHIDPQAITDAIGRGVRAVYICNPNNPTGRVEPRDKIEKIVRECSDAGVLVFLDETLLELVSHYDEISCVRLVNKYDNVVVAGSLTKSFAIPGIRIGFGFASESITEQMEKVRMTWNVGQIEQTVAKTLIGERMNYVRRAADMMASESVVMNKHLNDIGFPTGKVSDSFFYFNSLKDLGIKCAEFKDLMLRNGIMIRDCASFGDPFEWFVRYSVKDRVRNEMFVAAVERSLKELGN